MGGGVKGVEGAALIHSIEGQLVSEVTLREPALTSQREGRASPIIHPRLHLNWRKTPKNKTKPWPPKKPDGITKDERWWKRGREEESRKRQPRIQGRDEGGLERPKGAARGVAVSRRDSNSFLARALLVVRQGLAAAPVTLGVFCGSRDACAYCWLDSAFTSRTIIMSFDCCIIEKVQCHAIVTLLDLYYHRFLFVLFSLEV